MTKAELVDHIYSDNDITKKATSKIVDDLFKVLSKAIQEDGRFNYPGFGTFTVKDRKGRNGRNPRTGEKIWIPPSKTVRFKPAPKFKDSLNGES